MSEVQSPQEVPLETVADVTLTDGGSTARESTEKGSDVLTPVDGVHVPAQSNVPPKVPGRSPLSAKVKLANPAGKVEPVQINQEFVEVKCPYCGHKNEIVLDRGRRAKPFFVPCDKCSEEFAVKLVQVLVYQAQVAGFR